MKKLFNLYSNSFKSTNEQLVSLGNPDCGNTPCIADAGLRALCIFKIS